MLFGDCSQLDNVVKSSKQLSRLTLQLQRERDQLVLYNSQIGADSKTFLLRSYAETDRVISSMTEWPVKKTDDAPDEFSSKVYTAGCRCLLFVLNLNQLFRMTESHILVTRDSCSKGLVSYFIGCEIYYDLSFTIRRI